MSNQTVHRQLAELGPMTAAQLRDRYEELFGDRPRSGNRQWLFRRCAWRVQALAEGGLSERARKRALAIANDADIRFIPPRQPDPAPDLPRQVLPAGPVKPDDRLPMVQTALTRAYKGRLYSVEVQPNGFIYNGDLYKSLTAVAYAITGAHWNGYHFFRKSLHEAQRKEVV
ncbi:MAG TPA: DUF2924 domain-containing protein [Phycisphaerae bacterium]|nr:DUF2924 domain-containing protein [Phycisphaerae bacterium]